MLALKGCAVGGPDAGGSGRTPSPFLALGSPTVARGQAPQGSCPGLSLLLPPQLRPQPAIKKEMLYVHVCSPAARIPTRMSSSPKAAPAGTHPASREQPGVSPRAASSARMPWSGPGCSALSSGGISLERRCCEVLPSL